MSGHTLQCPKCGGPLPAHGARQTVSCPFCHVAVAPPPEVVEHVVDRVLVTKVAAGDPGALHCPRCATALAQLATDGTAIAGCRGCGGLWLDNAAVERLTKTRDLELEQRAARMVGLAQALPPEIRLAAIACPACSSALRRVQIPDTIFCVDVCDAHGTWFDRAELPIFMTAFQEKRTGELSDDDLRAAGIPGGGTTSDGDAEPGFFTDLFRSLRGLA
jgi:Zn-finger nucleic acid-binding protein